MKPTRIYFSPIALPPTATIVDSDEHGKSHALHDDGVTEVIDLTPRLMDLEENA